MEDLGGKVEEKLESFKASIDSIEQILPQILDRDLTNNLSTEDKLQNDIFMSYMLNTLFWMYLRSTGIDPNTNNVKQELMRVKEYMSKAKLIEDSKNRPKVNVPVAGRFIKHNLNVKRKHEEDKHINTKRKFK